MVSCDGRLRVYSLLVRLINLHDAFCSRDAFGVRDPVNSFQQTFHIIALTRPSLRILSFLEKLLPKYSDGTKVKPWVVDNVRDHSVDTAASFPVELLHVDGN